MLWLIEKEKRKKERKKKERKKERKKKKEKRKRERKKERPFYYSLALFQRAYASACNSFPREGGPKNSLGRYVPILAHEFFYALAPSDTNGWIFCGA